MSTAAPTPTPQTTTEPPTVKLPEPEYGHRWIQVPDDFRLSAIQAQAIYSLCRIDGGDLVADLNEKLPQLVAACGTLNKKGSLSIKMAISPGGMGKMEIAYDIDMKLPKEKKHPSLLFCTEHGQLLNRDPHQMELDLQRAKVVTIEPQTLRIVEPPPPPPLR